MTDREHLLRAILTHPDDDAPRLAYADWCRENGYAERAELIQLGCQAADDPSAGARLDDRHRALSLWLAGGLAVELLETRDLSRAATPGSDGWLIAPRHYLPGGLAFRVHRGFIEEVRCTPDSWEHHATAWRSRAPLRSVWLTSWPTPETGYPAHEPFSIRIRGGAWWVWRHLVRAGEAPAASLYRAEWPGIDFYFPPSR